MIRTYTMKMILVPVMILLCVAGLSISWAAPVAQTSLDTTVTDGGNLRSGPGTTFDIITYLRVGTVVRLDGRNQSGEWVRGITASGAVGWMSNGLLAITLSDVTSLPIIRDDALVLVGPPGQAAASASNGAANNTAPVAGLADGIRTTATNNVNVRSGPGTSFARVGGLFFEQPFIMDGRNADSTWVRGIIPDGTLGWVAVSFVTLTVDDLAVLPVVEVGAGSALSGAATAAPASQPEAETAPPPAPVVNTAPVSGFSYGGHVQGINERSIMAMRRAGMTWIKKQVRFSGGFEYIEQAHNAGFRILLGVVGDRTRVNDDGYIRTYADEVARLAAAGADAIEIWNEPNIDREWITGDINPERYTELLRLSYNAIKAANPNTLVISGAPAPTGAEAAFPGAVMNDDRYMQRMAAAGAANYMDCIGIHYNEGIVPPSQTAGDPRGDYYTRYLRSMMDVYYNAFNGARPLCFTELGYLTPEGYGPLPGAFGWAENVTIAQQASWLDQAVSLVARSGRTRLLIVWNVDFTNYDNDPMAGYAMIRADGSCPACDALGS